MVKKATKNDNMKEIRYNTNFLIGAVARLDFLSPLDEVKSRLPPKISRKAKLHFPIAEPNQVLARELQVSPTETRTKDVRATEWNFYGKNREKLFAIGTGAALIQFDIYSTYEVLKQEFIDVMSVVFDTFPDLQGKRLGLRYINSIDIPGDDPLSWNEYINPQLLGILATAPDKKSLSRSFHVLEYNYGNFNLRHQFGIPNPDFPAPIKQRQFVIDIDAYCGGILEKTDISANLDTFHEKIQELFEMSITDSLRKLMNDE